VSIYKLNSIVIIRYLLNNMFQRALSCHLRRPILRRSLLHPKFHACVGTKAYDSGDRRVIFPIVSMLALATTAAAVVYVTCENTPFAVDKDDIENSPLSLDNLPEYTSEDVAKNNGENGTPIWMSYGGVVYDVTKFVANHPGGMEKIMQAAGNVRVS
jgi:Cytochrome b5-like Heme/Steroid binding domain